MGINVLEIGALFTALASFGVLYFFKKKHVNFGLRTLIATAFGLIIALSYNKVVRKDESVKPFKAFVDAIFIKDYGYSVFICYNVNNCWRKYR